MFGLPLVVRLRQRSSGYDRVTGIRLTRQEAYARYRADVGPAFRSPAGRYRILAPHIAPRFDPGGVDGAYLNSEIDAAWSKWANDGFAVNHLGESFTGRVIGDVLSATMGGTQPFSLWERVGGGGCLGFGDHGRRGRAGRRDGEAGERHLRSDDRPPQWAVHDRHQADDLR
jgi:hypothetical protein